ncbi:nucleotidyltransferase family protein [Pontibacter oryzae]|uniref:glucose-1-phosphate thymidylyltransferase n=1 Tax=Pontibacter oryzae TaxID=2304593 RepID=A0A399RR99_9BACT|nr:sugar phosphate nucleotidyltransferase [Pontibacter oryzae]RIJ34380.1 dTDP-glucose pyrophosphorylase [Pontibacter oryzae]
MKASENIVGLIPAAGLGSRLSPIPCSKELLPIGFQVHPEHGEDHPKVVSQYLLEHMRRGGASQVYVILRKGKWDIPDYFGDGSQLNLHLAYLLMQRPHGCPYSIDQAYAFVKQSRVLFGFPNILFEPGNAFEQLLHKQKTTAADVVLGCFKVSSPHKWDMVKLQAGGIVKSIHHKPEHSDLAYAWAIACWGPRFTDFMHTYLQQQEVRLQSSGAELSIGEVVQAALNSGLLVQSVCFANGNCLDVGTPKDFRKAIKILS